MGMFRKLILSTLQNKIKVKQISSRKHLSAFFKIIYGFQLSIICLSINNTIYCAFLFFLFEDIKMFF